MLTSAICTNFRKGVEARARITGVRPLPAASADGARLSTVATPVWFETSAQDYSSNPNLTEEIFGPSSLVVWCKDSAEMLTVAADLSGNLTATLHAGVAEVAAQGALLDILANKAGRVILNGFPTGLEVSSAIVHSGPYPATSDGGRSTSVGTRALTRWVRLVCYQNFTQGLLPPELQNANPQGLRRLVNGAWTTGTI